jgi:hypothetical protein
MDKTDGLAADRKVISAYLTGDAEGEADLRAALTRLLAHAPGELARLKSALRGDDDVFVAAAACEDVIPQLAAYVNLGAGAETAMPGIAAHLQTCQECCRVLEVQKATAATENAWRGFAKRLAPKRPFLVLLRSGWHWRGGEDRSVLATKEKGQGLRLGGWLIGTSRQAALPLTLAASLALEGGGPPRALTLERELAGSAGRLNVLITPVFDATRSRELWQFTVTLAEGNQAAWGSVGISDSAEACRDMRGLTPGHPVEFTLPPPQDGGYWLYWEWQKPDGVLVEECAELPAVSEPTGGKA